MIFPSFLYGTPEELRPRLKKIAKSVARGASLGEFAHDRVDALTLRAPILQDYAPFPSVAQFQCGLLTEAVRREVRDGLRSPRWLQFLNECYGEPWSYLLIIGQHGALSGRPEWHLPALRAAEHHLPAYHALGARFSLLDVLQLTPFWQTPNAILQILSRYDISGTTTTEATELDVQLGFVREAIKKIESGVAPIPWGALQR